MKNAHLLANNKKRLVRTLYGFIAIFSLSLFLPFFIGISKGLTISNNPIKMVSGTIEYCLMNPISQTGFELSSGISENKAKTFCSDNSVDFDKFKLQQKGEMKDSSKPNVALLIKNTYIAAQCVESTQYNGRPKYIAIENYLSAVNASKNQYEQLIASEITNAESSGRSYIKSEDKLHKLLTNNSKSKSLPGMILGNPELCAELASTIAISIEGNMGSLLSKDIKPRNIAINEIHNQYVFSYFEQDSVIDDSKPDVGIVLDNIAVAAHCTATAKYEKTIEYEAMELYRDALLNISSQYNSITASTIKNAYNDALRTVKAERKFIVSTLGIDAANSTVSFDACNDLSATIASVVDLHQGDLSNGDITEQNIAINHIHSSFQGIYF